MLAWAFHRISGIAIWLFVLLHVLDIYLAGGNPNVYDEHPQVLRQHARPDQWRYSLERHSCTTASTVCGSWPWTSGRGFDRLPQADLVRELDHLRRLGLPGAWLIIKPALGL